MCGTVFSVVWRSVCLLFVGQFGVGLGDRFCALCGAVSLVFGGVGVCCVWESLLWDWWREFVLCVGQFVWVWGNSCLLCAGQFAAGFRERVCSVCGIFWCWFGGVSFYCELEIVVWVLEIECLLCVVQIFWLWGSEFVLYVLEFCVVFGDCVCAVFGIVWCGF